MRRGTGPPLPALPRPAPPWSSVPSSPTPTPTSSPPGLQNCHTLAALPLRPQAQSFRLFPLPRTPFQPRAAKAKSPPLGGPPAGASRGSPQPHWCLWVCPQDTRALGPGTPSPQALAPWPCRARVTEGWEMPRGLRARGAAHRDGSLKGRSTGWGGGGVHRPPWARVPAPACLHVPGPAGFCRSPASRSPLGTQGLHPPAHGHPPPRVPAPPKTEDVPPRRGLHTELDEGHTPWGVKTRAVERWGAMRGGQAAHGLNLAYPEGP